MLICLSFDRGWGGFWDVSAAVGKLDVHGIDIFQLLCNENVECDFFLSFNFEWHHEIGKCYEFWNCGTFEIWSPCNLN